ncbi:MAG: DUF5694 domain-containing protein [Janthinobacterium lividum]
MKRESTIRANDVIVLGTPHLSELKAEINLEILAPLLKRLVDWRPTAIASERLSGLQCDSLRRYPFRYAATVKTRCTDPAPADRALGLDVPAANAEVERTLASWPASPTAAMRRHLAALFLAAGEPASALVQWLSLPPADRRDGDGLSPDLVAALHSREAGRSEVERVAVPLAVRLNLQRVWSIDDHTSDSDTPLDTPEESKASEAALTTAWNNPTTHASEKRDAQLAQNLKKPDGILALYRAMNAADAPDMTYKSDMGAALAEPSPQGFGRQYVGYWETRNLRMAANIRDILGLHPGTRLLVIVGASHKGFLEAYLNQMTDVTLQDSAALLR